MSDGPKSLLPFRQSLAGTLLATREALMAQIRPILREAGVTEQQWRVLRVLVDEGTVDSSRLAREALLHPASVTRIVREMNERALVTKETDLEDGRRSLVSIMPEGRALVKHTGERTVLILRSYYKAFGADRLSNLIEELRELQVAINGVAPKEDAQPETETVRPKRVRQG